MALGLKKGIEECNGLYIGWTHGDLQTDIFDIIQIYSKLQNNKLQDNHLLVFKGVRYGRRIIDRIISKSMSLISSVLFFHLPPMKLMHNHQFFINQLKMLLEQHPTDMNLTVMFL